MVERVVASRVDDNGVLWETVETLGGGSMTRAVCRPESCADGHKCGKLDVGLERSDRLNTQNDLALFAEQFTGVVSVGSESVGFGNLNYKLDGGTLEIGIVRAVDPSDLPRCGCRHDWPTITPLMREVARMIDEFHELPMCGTGGPLHIVTDDSNVDDDALGFCWQATFEESPLSSRAQLHDPTTSDGFPTNERYRGWWRLDQEPDDTARMVRMACAILWGLGAMSIPEREVVCEQWPLTTDPNPEWCIAPHQRSYLNEVEWGFESVRPDWVCDKCWAQAVAVAERRANV